MKQEDRPSSAEPTSPWRRLGQWARKRPTLVARWEAIRGLVRRGQDALLPYQRRFEELERSWKRKLGPLCGSAYDVDWNRFRPLRLSREEDWSDWLAWLLKTSVTGLLGETIFGTFLKDHDFKTPKVEREYPKGQERRVDLALQWRTGDSCTSLEVKVKDKNFEKTFETCQMLERCKPGVRWNHAILIPDRSENAWSSVVGQHERDEVRVVLWRDVAHGLRKCLWANQEPVCWKAWAWSFCRAVEHHLLELRRPPWSNRGASRLVMAARWVDLLETDRAEINMNMKPEMKAFLEEGLRVYADAKDTVETFEKELERLFGAALEGKPTWTKQRTMDKLALGGTGDGDQFWLCTHLKGQCPLGKEVDVECGLWWNTPKVAEPIIFYTCLWRGEEGIRFKWAGGNDPIRNFDLYDRTHLYLPVPASLEIEGPLDDLFNAILRHLTESASAS